MHKKERKDPYTGEMFIPKRSNQKFKTNKNRIAFHNERAKEKRDLLKPINSIVAQDFLIIVSLLGDKLSGTFKNEFLRGAGFSFKAMTHIQEYSGKKYPALYNFVIIKPDNEKTKFIDYGRSNDR